MYVIYVCKYACVYITTELYSDSSLVHCNGEFLKKNLQMRILKHLYAGMICVFWQLASSYNSFDFL